MQMQPKQFVQETPDLCRVRLVLPLEGAGPEAEDAALNAGVDTTLRWLSEEQQFMALDEPAAEVLATDSKSMTVEFTVPLLPREAVLTDCADLCLHLCPAPVPQRVVDGRLKLLRLSHYTLRDSDAPAERNDVVFFDYAVQGTTQRGESVQMTIGGPELYPGLGAALCGRHAGEHFECRLPNGRVCCGVLCRVCRKEYLVLDDAFARKVGGCDSLVQLRSQLEEQLAAQEFQKARTAALEKTISQAVTRLCAPDISGSLAALYSVRLTGRLQKKLFPQQGAFEKYLAAQGLTPQQFEEKNRPAVYSHIRKRMALLLLAKQQGLLLTEKDYHACEKRLAQESGIDETEVYSRCPRSVFTLEVHIQAAQRWLGRETL